MAINKIERLDREIQKTREKITEQQNKLKELTAQKTEADNLQIVQLVRAMLPLWTTTAATSSSLPVPPKAATISISSSTGTTRAKTPSISSIK